MTRRPAAHANDTRGSTAAPLPGGGASEQVCALPLHHEFANTLHGILLQVRCAEWALDKRNTADARKNLAQIEAAVSQAHHLLRKLKHMEQLCADLTDDMTHR